MCCDSCSILLFALVLHLMNLCVTLTDLSSLFQMCQLLSFQPQLLTWTAELLLIHSRPQSVCCLNFPINYIPGELH